MEKMSREFDVDFTGFMKSLEALDGFSEIEHNSSYLKAIRGPIEITNVLICF